MNHTQFRLVLCLVISAALHSLLLTKQFSWSKSLHPVYGSASVLSATVIPAFRESVVNSAVPETEQGRRGKAEPTLMREVQGSGSVVAGKQSTIEPLFSMPLIDDYLPVSLLTERPHPVDSIDLTPPGWSVKGVVGEVELLLLISSSGKVDAVVLVSTSLPEAFVDYAESAFKAARFTPGMVRDRAVRSRMRIVLSPNPVPVAAEPGLPRSAKTVADSKNR